MSLSAVRPHLTSIQLSFLTTAYLLAFANARFWATGLEIFGPHKLELAALALALFLLGSSLLIMVSVKYVIKPVFIALVLVAATASYFTQTFGTLIDRDMIQNAMETTGPEAGHLLTPALFAHIALYGLLPAALIAFVRVDHRRVLAKAGWNTAVIVPSLIVVCAIVFSNYSVYASTFRAHREFLASLNPAASLVASVKYAVHETRSGPLVVQPLGLDAKRMPKPGDRPRVLVVVVGETARAANFSLLGYDRPTNPKLSARDDILAFSNVSSCGTATAISVPCMFSVYPRSDYSEDKSDTTENVLDVLTHAGVGVEWFDNNTGSKKVADRVPYEFLPETNDPRYCEGGECRDDILTDRLVKALGAVEGDTVIVLHQLGSHGPAYYARYDETARHFTPDCRTAEFADCSREEIVNAYDNTIVETDRFLDDVVTVLGKASDRLDTAMLYVSDHGESLGEKGLYLHAAPYFLAPSEQTHVPMIAWLSDGFQSSDGIETACLAKERDEAFSHDNLFHTVLGLMGVGTKVYDRALDIAAPCRDNGLVTSSLEGPES
ncbi:phosphoethanolamine--lipid A transferase [Fulvimarina endophytica]|uniref:Phosphoethanolamine--lipid A transferase n=1 Tax=Fulvimarina endophytica TaxID=2293836 RepID=A0A371X5H7_9HYPH|nr:phosphoethanolamine--lipid A transferase [Fulvimarina endophytica]RFC64480.1 phosphoethanolamine--lipid A transferase [Fulvimarina endophytica]